MPETIITELLNVTDVATSGEGSVVNTIGASVNKNVRPQPNPLLSADARFSISVTGFTGTDMLVELVAEIGGVDVVIGAFTSVTGAVVESVVVTVCPENVKVKYTANAVTDFDATVHSVRI